MAVSCNHHLLPHILSLESGFPPLFLQEQNHSRHRMQAWQKALLEGRIVLVKRAVVLCLQDYGQKSCVRLLVSIPSYKKRVTQPETFML